MTHHDVRVMVIDDSVVTRVIVARIIDAMAGHAVVAAVGGIGAALPVLARERIDVILLDLNLPEIDGLSGLPTLAALAPHAAILVLSATCDDGSAAALHARSLGAVATIAKPASSAMVGRFAERLQTAVSAAVRPAAAVVAPQDAWDVVAIGASTGGIHALAPLLAAIPPDCDVPMLLTQHLPASFTGYFAGQLTRLAQRPVDIATDSLRIRRGRMVLAPGDAHLRVVATTDGAAIRLDRTPAVSGCMPSVDPMFESVARVYGARALVVVLSGMGRDGCRGAARVQAHGGTVAAQERQSSVVWGMPGAVVEAGLATTIGTPAQLGAFIAKGRRPS